MSQKGRLTEWNDERGFGFVTGLDGGARAFAHVSEFPHASRRPAALDLLTYETRYDDRGRLQAYDVRFLTPVVAAHHALGSDASEVPLQVPLAALAAVLLGGFLLRTQLASLLFFGYVVMSLVTYLAYAADKSAARRGRFRTQESALHLLEVAGGWPGALLAQRRLRHKTKKRSYQVEFWALVVVNLIALGLVFALSPMAPG